jgi:hypothetical protein
LAVVHRDKELVEKFGRNHLCPYGSDMRSKKCRLRPLLLEINDQAMAPLGTIIISSIATGGRAFCSPYAAGMIALVLWNLRKLISKLEPVGTEVVTPPSSAT